MPRRGTWARPWSDWSKVGGYPSTKGTFTSSPRFEYVQPWYEHWKRRADPHSDWHTVEARWAHRLNRACSPPPESRVRIRGRRPIRAVMKSFGSGSWLSWAK